MSGNIIDIIGTSETATSMPSATAKTMTNDNLIPVRERQGSGEELEVLLHHRHHHHEELCYGQVDEEQKKIHLENMISNRGVPHVQVSIA